MEITKGIMRKPLRAVVYGPEGIGKTTFASQFPNPVFIDTENSTEFLDVPRYPRPSSWTMLMEELTDVYYRAGEFQTLVLDTADWAEALCKSHVCQTRNVSGIEDFGYGKGYVYLAEEWGKMLNLLTALRDERGMNIVITAHAALRKFEQPDEMGSYDRWELKLEKKTAPLVKEWADVMLFANYETYVVETKEKKKKAQGGRRVMYTTHHPCWDAKNRQGLPEKLPFEFSQIAHVVPNASTRSTEFRNAPEPARQSDTLPTTHESLRQIEQTPLVSQTETKSIDERTATVPKNKDTPERIPKPLADLMTEHRVSEQQIQTVVAARGYYPPDTPISKYDPDFVSGVLVGAWEQVYNMIKGA